jgi:hypothetical protein
VAYDPTEDEELKKQATLGAGSGGSPMSGSMSGSPAAPKVNQTAPNGNFINLQTYLGANKDQIGQMANKLTSSPLPKAEDIKQTSAEIQTGARAAPITTGLPVQYNSGSSIVGTTGMNPAPFKGPTAPPVPQVPQASSPLPTTGQFVNTTYGGPEVDGLYGYGSQLDNAEAALSDLGNIGGIKTQLAAQGMTGGSAGGNRLNAALLQAGGGDAFNARRQEVGNLRGLYGSELGASSEAVGGAKSQVAAQKQSWEDYQKEIEYDTAHNKPYRDMSYKDFQAPMFRRPGGRDLQFYADDSHMISEELFNSMNSDERREIHGLHGAYAMNDGSAQTRKDRENALQDAVIRLVTKYKKGTTGVQRQ